MWHHELPYQWENEFLCQFLKFWIATAYIFNATSLVQSHIQDSDDLLLCRAADDLVVWGYARCTSADLVFRGYAHCTKSVVISSVSLAHLGCSQRHGKCKEEWTAWGELDADDWIRILGILQKKVVINYQDQHTVSPVARLQVQMWCIWYSSHHNGTLFCIATTLGFMHLFLRRWWRWKSYQTLIGKVCGLQTIFAWLLVCRYMYQQTHGTGAPLHLSAFPGSASLIDDYRCIRKGNKVVLFQQLETHWPQSSKTIYCFGRYTTVHVQVIND